VSVKIDRIVVEDGPRQAEPYPRNEEVITTNTGPWTIAFQVTNDEDSPVDVDVVLVALITYSGDRTEVTELGRKHYSLAPNETVEDTYQLSGDRDVQGISFEGYCVVNDKTVHTTGIRQSIIRDTKSIVPRITKEDVVKDEETKGQIPEKTIVEEREYLMLPKLGPLKARKIRIR
jgi:hypothetical protein|tara:strand:+ start:86 stop:610 length:525 start_codon:yes stop_codon:yes gene_type:complete